METDAYDDDLPACASCEDAQKDYDNLEMVANNLAAIVRRLAHALRDVSPTHDLPGKALDYLKREGFAGQPIRKVGACETAKPVAWIRFCSDGCYEGPIMDEQIEDVRKNSGAWTPLYLGHN